MPERNHQGRSAEIICNECGAVVRRVPAGDLEKTIEKMELTLDVASAKCPHCGAEKVFPGFSAMKAFICQHCGKSCSKE